MQSSDSNAIELSMLEICPKIAKVAVTAEPTGVLNSVDQSTFYDDNSSQESEHGEEQLAHNVADKPLPEKPLPAKPLPLPPGETEAEPEYPTGPKLILISFALCLAVFLVTLDRTIIANAIPQITDQFHSLDDIGWYGSAYLMTTASSQLIFGKLYSFFSIKLVFLATITIFEVGSLVSGAAPNSPTLIVGRCIAGIGCAGAYSGALVVAAHSVPLHRRPVYSGLIGSTALVAAVAGPILGGAFTQRASWRWCFYINLPIGAITFLVIATFLKSPQQEKMTSLSFQAKFKYLDPLGAAIFMPGVVCLLLALQWGGTRFPWSNGVIIGLFILSGVLAIVFIAIQIWKQEEATLPPRIISQRSMAFGTWFSFSSYAAFILLTYFLPVWFQAVKDASPIESGIMTLPQTLGVLISTLIAGILVSKLGYYTPFMLASSAIISAGAGLYTTWRVDTGPAARIGYQALFGFGLGLGFQAPIIAAQTVMSIDDIPIATSAILFAQTLGGAIFVSVGESVFENRLASGLVARVPSVNPVAVISTGATGFRRVVDSEDLPAVLVSYNGALTKTFVVCVVMACLSMIGAAGMEWRSVKGEMEVGKGES